MNILVERAIEEVAKTLNLEKSLVKRVIYDYFSRLQVTFYRGKRSVKIEYLGKFTRNGTDRSKWKFGNKDSKGDTTD
jgi:nucleoid DNA-binding protein